MKPPSRSLQIFDVPLGAGSTFPILDFKMQHVIIYAMVTLYWTSCFEQQHPEDQGMQIDMNVLNNLRKTAVMGQDSCGAYVDRNLSDTRTLLGLPL